MKFYLGYTLNILSDAQLYADHAGRPSDSLELDDIRLAVDARLAHSFTSRPDKETLAQLAEKRNARPLPLMSEKFGVRLPPEKYALTGVEFQIVPKVCNIYLPPIVS